VSFSRNIIENPHYLLSRSARPLGFAFLLLEELGYLDEKKEKNKKAKVHNEEWKKLNSKNNGEEQK